VNILLWHVHGSWTTAFVQGAHNYLLPVLEGRGPDGRGRAQTWDWPSSAVEVTPEQARQAEIDLVVLQRPEELSTLAERWTGRLPGRDLPALYLEHNTPEGRLHEMVHPAVDRDDITIVHVTHFNRIFWDTGRTSSVVIEHGIVDPGYLYSGEIAHGVAVINDPGARGRVTGTDLLGPLSREMPIDLYGMRSEPYGGSDLPQGQLHLEMARRRAYVHPNRWTSLGLSLIEAMHLGMPVVGLSVTESPEAISHGAGVVSNDLEVLHGALRLYANDRGAAEAAGRAAREWALQRYGLKTFLDRWDDVLAGVRQ
jgi:glycosyltransferase involved in cell wall biosynthesis